jgi:hypothetical protein
MTDEKTVTEVMPPIAVTVIGTGDGLTRNVTATTPHDQPNLAVNIISPLVAIAVRFGNTFCVSLAGSLAAGGITSKVIPHSDIGGMLEPAVILAACIAGVGLIKDFGTVFSGLEKKFPLASGSV